MVVLVLGLPGSGKTFFAKALARQLKVPHVNTDQVRNEIKKRGHYNERSKAEVYNELLKRVEVLLPKDDTIIVDATFSKQTFRTLFINLANKYHRKICVIKIVASEKNIKERLKVPRPDSEADFEIYKLIRNQYEPIEMEHLILQSDILSIYEMMEKAKEYMKLKIGDE